jgi:2-oxo-4-hydroxy-4-carboxy-5-ureidoimidazoline decarboxylase
MMKFQDLNRATDDEAVEALLRCCASRRWALEMVAARPFESRRQLFERSDEIWWKLDEEDWLEAFSAHPKIGDIDSLREKYSATKTWSEGEQQGVSTATDETLERLAAANDAYEERFGYIFIVCATGKSAREMLAILEERLPNEAVKEIRIAAGEQAKITRIRLEKLLK